MNTFRLLILGLALGGALILAGCTSQPKRELAAGQAIEVINEEDFWALIPRNQPPGMPVLYFLHGRGNTEFMFQDMGGVERYLEYVAKGGRPFAVVAFNGNEEGRDYYWVDEVGPGGKAWATYLMRELLPALEKRFHIGGARERRMIAGISMGSAGSYQLAMNFPGLFRCVAGHSMVVRDAASAVKDFPIAFGSEEIYRERFDPIELAKKYRARGEKPFEKAWLDIGGKDNPAWIARAGELAGVLESMGYPKSRFDVAEKYPEQGHTYEYWRGRMAEYMTWYADCLNP